MVAFAKTEGGLQALAEEYHAFLDAHAAAPDIMRFRISGYNTHRIGAVLDGLPYPDRHFTAQPNFLRQCKMFITQDEIDHYFLREGVESRLAIYSHFCYPHTRRNIRNSSKAALVSTAAEPAPDMDTPRLTKGWSTNGTISPRNMIPST